MLVSMDLGFILHLTILMLQELIIKIIIHYDDEINKYSTPVSGQIIVENWVYMVVIPQVIAQ